MRPVEMGCDGLVEIGQDGFGFAAHDHEELAGEPLHNRVVGPRFPGDGQVFLKGS